MTNPLQMHIFYGFNKLNKYISDKFSSKLFLSPNIILQTLEWTILHNQIGLSFLLVDKQLIGLANVLVFQSLIASKSLLDGLDYLWITTTEDFYSKYPIKKTLHKSNCTCWDFPSMSIYRQRRGLLIPVLLKQCILNRIIALIIGVHFKHFQFRS